MIAVINSYRKAKAFFSGEPITEEDLIPKVEGFGPDGFSGKLKEQLQGMLSENAGKSVADRLKDVIKEEVGDYMGKIEELTSAYAQRFKEMAEKQFGATGGTAGSFVNKLYELMFDFEQDMADVAFDPNQATEADEYIKNQIAAAQELADALGKIQGGLSTWFDGFQQFTQAMLDAGYSTEIIAQQMRQVRELQMNMHVLQMLGGLRDVIEQTKGSASKTWDKVNKAWNQVADQIVEGADTFIDDIYKNFGSPEKLAEIFARQNYISQNVNQNIVITPYVQISGVEDEEAIIEIVNKAFKDAATEAGLAN
jgi:hypothetical protein